MGHHFLFVRSIANVFGCVNVAVSLAMRHPSSSAIWQGRRLVNRFCENVQTNCRNQGALMCSMTSPSPGEEEGVRTKASRFVAVAVPLAVMIVYGQIVWYGWLNYDDTINVTENPWLNPVTVRGLAHLWKQAYAGLYIPVAYTLFAAEAIASRWLSGASPGAIPDASWFRIVSLGLQSLNGLLVLHLLNRGLGFGRMAATLGALLFVIHPVQVEAVAWISDQRGLLSAAFGLLAMGLAFHGGTARNVAWSGKDVFALGLFFLSLLAKPQAVSLPLIMLVLGGAKANRVDRNPAFRNWCLFVVPWMVVVIAIAIVSRSLQPGEAVAEPIRLWQRPVVAGDALAHHAEKLFVPWNLAVDYGRGPDVILADKRSLWVAGSAWLVVGLCMAWPRLEFARVPMGVWVAGLLPTLGFMPFLHQGISTVADRYAYLAMLGPAIAYAAAWNAAAHRPWRPCLRAILLAGLVLAGAVARGQVPVWRNSQTLFQQCLKVNPNSFAARLNLGTALVEAGKLHDAVPVLRSAIAASGEYKVKYKPHAALAQALHRLGERQEAEKAYQRAI
jgi:protein O-mannosyl-transferase